LEGSTVFAAGSGRGFVVIGICALIGGAAAAAGLAFVVAGGEAAFEVFAGAVPGFALLVSLPFGSACAAVFDDGAVLLAAGFFAGAAVLGAAFFVVVFVAIFKS
jgi:hypothetical protein